MREIKCKDNVLGLPVFINGVPNLKAIPTEEADLAISALELVIANHFEHIRNLEKPVDNMIELKKS